MANLFSNSCRNLSYWFSETTIDNNGEVVSDINAGLLKLLPELMDKLNVGDNAEKRFIIPDCQVAIPDVAAKTFYSDENMWWYICLENNIANPFKEYTNNLLFYVFNESYLTNQDQKITNTTNSKNSKIGTIVELN